MASTTHWKHPVIRPRAETTGKPCKQEGQTHGVPSGNQTWFAGKWTIEIADFPIETSIDRGFSWIFHCHVWLLEGRFACNPVEPLKAVGNMDSLRPPGPWMKPAPQVLLQLRSEPSEDVFLQLQVFKDCLCRNVENLLWRTIPGKHGNWKSTRKCGAPNDS